MKTVKSYNKQNDTTYVYEVLEAHWNKEKGIMEPRRRLIGKIDKETGEIIPTGRRGRKKKTESPPSDESIASDYSSLYASALSSIQEKDKEIEMLKNKIRDLETTLNTIHKMTA